MKKVSKYIAAFSIGLLLILFTAFCINLFNGLRGYCANSVCIHFNNPLWSKQLFTQRMNSSLIERMVFWRIGSNYMLWFETYDNDKKSFYNKAFKLQSDHTESIVNVGIPMRKIRSGPAGFKLQNAEHLIDILIVKRNGVLTDTELSLLLREISLSLN